VGVSAARTKARLVRIALRAAILGPTLLAMTTACSPAGERVGLGGGFSGVLVDEGANVRLVSGDDASGVELAGEGFAGGTVVSLYEDIRAPAGFSPERTRRLGRFEATLYRLNGKNGAREYRWVVVPPDVRNSVALVAAFRCKEGGCRIVKVLFDTLTGPPLGAARTSPAAPTPLAPRRAPSAAGVR